jgi:hypothetical protein
MLQFFNESKPSPTTVLDRLIELFLHGDNLTMAIIFY